MTGDGRFAVAWQDRFVAGSHNGIAVRGYSSAGALRAAANVSTDSSSTVANENPLVALDDDLNATVAFRRTDFPANNADVVTRRFNLSGAAVQPIADGATLTNLSGGLGTWQCFKVTVPPGHAVVDMSIAGAPATPISTSAMVPCRP